MPTPPGRITPKRSAAVLALLCVLTIVASYLALLLLAVGCVILPCSLPMNSNTMQTQMLLLFLGGLAVAATILWSLIPRREKFVPLGPAIDSAAQPHLFAAIDEIASALNERAPQRRLLVE